MLEFDNIENIKRAVEIPSGISILPEPSLVQEIKAGTLVAIPIECGDRSDRLTRPLAIVHRRQASLEPAAARFLELLIAEDVTEQKSGSHRARTRDRQRFHLRSMSAGYRERPFPRSVLYNHDNQLDPPPFRRIFKPIRHVTSLSLGLFPVEPGVRAAG